MPENALRAETFDEVNDGRLTPEEKERLKSYRIRLLDRNANLKGEERNDYICLQEKESRNQEFSDEDRRELGRLEGELLNGADHRDNERFHDLQEKRSRSEAGKTFR